MKKIFLSMLCCMFMMLVHAQNPFVAKTIQDKALWQPWGSNPQYIDLDGDADLDAIYHKEQSGFANITLYVAENIGNYRFLEPTTLKYSSTEQISGNNFIYGDYNKDGLNDLVVFDYNNILKVFGNNGNMNFSLRHTISNNISLTNQVPKGKMSDVNNDGFDDIVFTSGDSIITYLGNAGFTFSRLSSFAGNNVYVTAFGKIDNDNFIDLLVSIDFSVTKYVKSLGNGRFGLPDTITNAQYYSGLSSTCYNTVNSTLQFFNYDDDADEEILFAKGSPSYSLTIADKVGGNWQNIPTNIRSTGCFQVIDLNNDGRQDILGGDSAIYLRVDTGLVKRKIPDIPMFDVGGPGFVDLNNDSIPEFISRYLWYQFDVEPNISIKKSGVILSTNRFQRSLSNQTFQDMDMDGDLDIVCNAQVDGFLTFLPYWMENVGASQFAGIHTLKGLQFPPLTIFSSYTSNIQFLDCDNNGFLDFINMESDSTLALYEFDSVSHYHFKSAITSSGTSVACRQYKLYDINKDGLTDVFYRDKMDMLYWQRNLGNGSFGNREFIGSMIFPDYFYDYYNTLSFFVINDLDKDKDIDILQYCMFGNKYNVFRNNGSNVFTQTSQTTFTDTVSGLLSKILNTGDFNNDGYLDLLVEGARVGYVKTNFLLGTPVGFSNVVERDFSFLHYLSTVFYYDCRILPSDYDADGDVDLVFFADDGSFKKIFIVENTGNIFENDRLLNIDYLKPANYPAYFGNDNSSVMGDLDNNGYPEFITFDQFGIDLLQFNQAFKNQRVGGYVFNDKNNNGIYDTTDVVIKNTPVEAQTDGGTSISNSLGYYEITTPSIGNYLLHCEPRYPFVVKTGYNDKSVTFPGSGIQQYDIPLRYFDYFYKVSGSISHYGRRCFVDNAAYFTIANEGTYDVHGTIKITTENISNTSFSITPDSISGNEYFFKVQIPLLSTFEMTSYFTNPAAGLVIKNEMSFIALNDSSTAVDTLNIVNTDIVTCSCDPNEKSVNPEGSTENQYIKIGEPLTYTIQFQNTGNDTAFRVVILDTLDNHLDPSTFNILSSSHPMSIAVEKDYIFRFIFDPIALPDSNINYLGSQGFVTFSVQPKPGVLSGSIVNNTAHIYFDFNDPVTTNNAFITYITSVPTYVNIEKVTNIKYYPNPTTGELYIQLEDYTAENQIALQITDISGKTIRSEVRQLNERNTLHTDISDLSSGVYLVHLTANGVLVGTAKVVVE